MRVSGSVAIVTGGGSGLGAATVRMLAGAGARVAVLDLPGSDGPDLAAEAGATFHALDVTDTASVERVLGRVASTLGGPHVLVGCAGIATLGRILDRDAQPYPIDAFRRTLDVNLVGAWDVCRWAAHHMAANEPGEDGERGVIVNVASIAGLEGASTQGGYAASKAAIAGLTLPLARDLARWGIRVNTIAPGPVRTPLLDAAPSSYVEQLEAGQLFPRRLPTPEDFAALVRSVVENVMLNAEVIRLDGGARLSADG